MFKTKNIVHNYNYKVKLYVAIPILLLIFIPWVLTLLIGICIYSFAKNFFNSITTFQICNQIISISLCDILFIHIFLIFYGVIIGYLFF